MKNNLDNVFAKMLSAFIAVASCCNCSQGMNAQQQQLNAPQQAGNQLQQVNPRIYYAMTNDRSYIGWFVRQAQRAYAFNQYNGHLNNLINAINHPGNADGVDYVCEHFSAHFGGVNRNYLNPRERHTIVYTNMYPGDHLRRARWVLNCVEDSIMNCRFTSLDYYQNGERYTLNASIPLLNVLPANSMTNWSDLFYDWNQRRWRGNIRANVTGNIESIEVYLNFDFNGWIIDGTIYPKKR